jgi:O-antigen ligase/tetratricopeptide (TPR) repeat protein
VLCPLAFGAAHPWPAAITEIAIFGLIVLWMLKLCLVKVKSLSIPHPGYRLWLPLMLFAGWILLELIPLPPSLERILSPATYELYAHSVWSLPVETGSGSAGRASPPVSSAFAAPHQKAAEAAGDALRWEPLSIQETLTKSWILKVLAYISLFVVVLQYPFGTQPNGVQAEFRFYRLVLRLIIIAGLAIAIIGIVQQATWNGRMLWCYVPYDWGGPQLFRADRARGPFINADHFANFLGLVFPLTLASALFPTFVASRRSVSGWRMFSACAAFVIFCALLLSLSRGGLLSVSAGTAVLIWLSSAVSRDDQSAYWHSKMKAALIAVCLLAALTITAVSFVGSSSRRTLDSRVGETIAEVKFAERLMLWKDTIAIVRDFPVFGVGLGCWPEIFPKYRSAPWSFDFFRETHNDYLELASETGLIGFALVAWLASVIAQRLRSAIGRLRSDVAPIYYALIGSIIGLSVHELVDFSLHIPANAIYLTVIVAIALRIAARTGSLPSLKHSLLNPWRRLSAAVCVAGTAILLMILALAQKKFVYPHEVAALDTPSEVAGFISEHPASAFGHLVLTQVSGLTLTADQQLAQLRTAVWLDPINPSFRDAYSSVLLREGQDEEAQKQIEYSVYYSPSPGTHPYLSDGALATLSLGQQEAVREGFESAITAGFPGAVDGLAWFYLSRGKFHEAGLVYASAAANTKDNSQKLAWLLDAGLQFAEAGLPGDAGKEFRTAASLSPSDPRPYQDLIEHVYAPARDFNGAKQAAAAGIAAGADQFSLDQSLAWVLWHGGELSGAEAAESAALRLRQYDPAALNLMGWIYLAEQKNDDAIAEFRRVTEMQPLSAQARFYLASAEERAFDFVSADEDYRHALALAPENEEIRGRYSGFRQRIAQNQAKEALSAGNNLTDTPDGVGSR